MAAIARGEERPYHWQEKRRNDCHAGLRHIPEKIAAATRKLFEEEGHEVSPMP